MDDRGTDAAEVRAGAEGAGTLARCAGTASTRALLLPGCTAAAPVVTRAFVATLLRFAGAEFELMKRCSRGSKAIDESWPRATPRAVEVVSAGARTARRIVEDAAMLAAVSLGALLSAFH
jgi:hypothetical protein